ncbi:MAG: DUF262 domain-containing protein [Bacteroidales bacterium]|nr:DUF262 domain-containing protein [Bacteroidales bacterium]
MDKQKYNNYPLTISQILGLIEANDIAIPEIQRPFVWRKSQVRDLMDSLYKGYPTGYIIIWKNPSVKLKNGQLSEGKKVLIDGQQRITALMTAIAGKNVVFGDYSEGRVKIAFDPFAAMSDSSDAEIFAVQTPAHIKSKRWIPDIAEIFRSDFSSFKFIGKYVEDNPEMDQEDLHRVIEGLKNLQHCNIGVIELDSSLDIDIVTDIFIRINSKGTALSQGDFVMSKIAADEIHGGNTLRKVVDYFSHLCKDGTFFNKIKEKDVAFASTEYLGMLQWLKDDKETVYDPECDDVLRVAFMHKCKRAKLADLVAMLSGRDFETKEYKEDIVEQTYRNLSAGVKSVISEYNFTQFMLAIRSAGFISKKLINSVMAIDFAYAVYLILQETKEVPVDEIKSLVQRWYVLSVLTGRYSSSPESAFAKDIRLIGEIGVKSTLKSIEDANLSDNFWNIQLNQNLTFVSSINPTYQVFLAAQIFFKRDSLLSHIPVGELVNLGGDIHHIFPKKYLVDNGYEKNQYNQVANYAYLDTPVNIKIGKKSPGEYLNDALMEIHSRTESSFKAIKSENEFMKNLEDNCIPVEILQMDHTQYDKFLEMRRARMTDLIKEYYSCL